MADGRLAAALRRARTRPVPELLLVAVAGGLVFAVAALLFPHHSSNHDEAVYLQAAAMLLDGRLTMAGGDIAGSVRPWFFVQDGSTLYPKYSPVVPGVFAVGMALGEPRLSLALVAAGMVGLTALLGRAAFDRETGLLAGLLLLASPGFLFTASTFLPYAPTTLLNLAFAVAYVRAAREGSRRWAAVAGGAVGLAFFARPYTAVLFAVPFVAHACWTLWATRGGDRFRPTLARQATTATLGTVGVAVALAYNWLLTGHPLLFPYQAFAPLDGLGFGRRALLGYERTYTFELALRSNALALRSLATRWSPLAPFGTLAAFAAAALTVVRSRGWRPSPTGLDARTLRWLLLGVVACVTVGNLYFWGTLNALGSLDDPTDGLIALFGPFYHFDLQPVLATYAAAGLVAGWRRGRAELTDRYVRRRALAVSLAALAVAAPLVAVVAAPTFAAPADRHAAYTERYETAYEPFDEDSPEGVVERGSTSPRSSSTPEDAAGASSGEPSVAGAPEDAVVFLPPAYGEWLNHPFQSLRNDPDLDGPRVYAVHRGPADFDVVDAYPDRDLYRYTYNGRWSPDPDEPIVPRLTRVETVRSERLAARTTVGIPDPDASVSVRLETSEGSVERTLTADEVGEELTAEWSVGPDGARLAGANGTAPLDDRDEVRLAITLTAPQGATLTYSEELTVRRVAGGVEVLWPPRTAVCTIVADCGREGRYFADRPDLYPEGSTIETSLVENGSSADANGIDRFRTGGVAAPADTLERWTVRWRTRPRWGPASSPLSARDTRSVPRARRSRG